MNQTSKYIILFADLIVFITAGYGIIVYKKLGRELKSFTYFLFLSGIIQLISAIFWLFKQNNMPLLHLYVAGGFFCLTLFYQEVLRGFIDKKIIWGTLIIFSIFTIINSLFIQLPYTFNSYALTVESILIVIFSLSSYMLMLNDIIRKNRLHLVKSLNWINSGLFIYYASSLLIFYYGEIFIRSFPQNFNLQTWILHSFFSVIMYCCFFIGLWNRPKN